MEKNIPEMPRAERELIRQYREYNDDKDQGGYVFTSLISELSKRVGSSNPAKIEKWVVEQEGKYRLVSTGFSNQTRANACSSMDDTECQEYLQTQARLKDIIENTTDPGKKAFFERLLALGEETPASPLHQ